MKVQIAIRIALFLVFSVIVTVVFRWCLPIVDNIWLDWISTAGLLLAATALAIPEWWKPKQHKVWNSNDQL